MADTNEKNPQENETVLVAYVTVHLESGESFELLPFEDAQDVKGKVGDLLQDWAKSGFLIRGSQVYPWHRVQIIEATKVEELSRSDSRRRLDEWQAKDVARLQQSFWKTKQARKKKDEGEEKDGGEDSQEKAA
ncbi:MAG TPA: hypothetical protein VGF88_01165 [Acidobacteriaceae bacterium]|jgi:hypothetical protein